MLKLERMYFDDICNLNLMSYSFGGLGATCVAIVRIPMLLWEKCLMTVMEAILNFPNMHLCVSSDFPLLSGSIEHGT